MNKPEDLLANALKNKESLSNIGNICPDCAEDRRTKWQEENKNTVIKKGDAIKAKFVDHKEKAKEHMWVRVTDVTVISKDLTLISGILDNDPFLVKNKKLGDEVIVSRADVEQHLSV